MRTFENAKNEPGDIYKHLPTLNEYAAKSDSVLEIGFGYGNSTLAFIEACRFVRTIEIDRSWNLSGISNAREYAKSLNTDYDIIYGDSRSNATLEASPDVDFLFIDGDHSYKTVKKELEMYASKARKYIGFHDIVTFGYRNMIINPGDDIHGINWAIEQFLETHPEWKIDYVNIFNNGLLILKHD